KRAAFPNIKQVVPPKEDYGKNEARFTGKYYQGSTVRGHKMEYSDGEKTVYLDPSYVATIKNRFPDAKMYIADPKRPVDFRVGDQTKAVLMPMMPPEKDDEIKELEKAIKSNMQ